MSYLLLILSAIIFSCASINNAHGLNQISIVDGPAVTRVNSNYVNNKAPLLQNFFIKLPVGAVQPQGWVKEYLLRQRDGPTGHLGEVSAWLQSIKKALACQ